MVETLKFGTLKWHHIFNASDEDIQFLKDEFYFHPLDLEDCQSPSNQRPKIDVYDNYYFLIFHYPHFDKIDKFIRIRELRLFWGPDYIITIGKLHPQVRKMFEEAKKTLSSTSDVEDEEFMFGSSDQLLYHILDWLGRSQRIPRRGRHTRVCTLPERQGKPYPGVPVHNSRTEHHGN